VQPPRHSHQVSEGVMNSGLSVFSHSSGDVSAALPQ
jgi:hypothetical protein